MQSLKEFYSYEFTNKANKINMNFGMESHEIQYKHKQAGSYFTHWLMEID